MTPEGSVLKAVCDLLAAERIPFRRWNSGAIRDASGRPVRFGQKGDADIIAFPKAEDTVPVVGLVNMRGEPIDARYISIRTTHVLWIECKSAKGRQTPEQKNFEQWCAENDMRYIVARSSDDVLAWLKANGVTR